jgi:hypothetical protein
MRCSASYYFKPLRSNIRWIALLLTVALANPCFAESQKGLQDTKCNLQPQSTILTPNSNSVTTSMQTINKDTLIALQTNGVTYWTALLSTANMVVSLSDDQGNAAMTFQQGITLNYMVTGDQYQVMLSGPILDNDTQYKITGKLIAIFTCCQKCSTIDK